MSFITTFLDISVSLPWLGKTWISTFCADLAEAARITSYVETIGNKADTLHKYASFSEEKLLKKAYESNIRNLLKKLRIKKVELAIDGKKDLYFGRNGGLNTRNIKGERGAEEVWEYIVLSIVYPVHIPLMAVRYYQGADLAKLCIELLEYAKNLPITIKKCLFDRGFYNAHLIDYLESKKHGDSIPYIIFVPQNKKIKNYIENTKGKIGVFKHQFKYSRDKSKWKPTTTIVVCKEAGVNKDGEPYDMVFATNLKPNFSLVRQYKRRWNIETGFRVMEEGKIKTKSNNPLIRLFYFLLRALFSAIWLLEKVIRAPITFKAYLRKVEKELRQYEVYKPPPIKPVL